MREEDSSRPRQARRLHSRRRGAGTAASNGAEVIRAKHRRQDRAQRDERKATKTTIQERRQGDSQIPRASECTRGKASSQGGGQFPERASTRTRGERRERKTAAEHAKPGVYTPGAAERARRPRPRPRPRPRAAAAGRSSAPPPRAFGMRPARGSSPMLSMRYLSGTTTPFFNIERASA